MPPSPRSASRRRPRTHRPWRTIGAAFGAVLLGLGGWQAWQFWRAQRVTLGFTAVPPDGVELTFFPAQLAFAAPSPPPAIGMLKRIGAQGVSVGAELVPQEAVVRYAAADRGTGYRYVRLGESPPPIELRPPGAVRGRVVEPIGLWSFGWRCAELRPVADAEVVVMGGGEHGIDLAAARTDAAGEFTVTGFDRTLDGLAVRVRAAGFTLEHRAILRRAPGDAEPDALVVALTPAPVLAGRVVGPPGFDASSLRLLARGLPGVEAVPAADGAFVLEHVPPGVQPRLLLHGLPPELAHVPVRARPGVRIDLVPAARVRGRVVDRASQAPIAGAMVFCGDDHAVRADAAGRFDLLQLPPGPATIDAKVEVRERRRRSWRTGSRPVQLLPGETLEDIVVAVEPSP